jgi:hypothetical protein
VEKFPDCCQQHFKTDFVDSDGKTDSVNFLMFF